MVHVERRQIDLHNCLPTVAVSSFLGRWSSRADRKSLCGLGNLTLDVGDDGRLEEFNFFLQLGVLGEQVVVISGELFVVSGEAFDAADIVFVLVDKSFVVHCSGVVV